MATLTRLLFHTSSFLLFCFTVFYDVSFVDIPHPPERKFGGRFKFLTFWNLLIQLCYFGYVTVLDVGSLYKKSCASENILQTPTCNLKKFRNDWYNIIGFPLSCFVFSTFWIIYAFDREMVYPKALDAFLPFWLNHLMHTVILPIALLEMILEPHHLPHRKKGLSVLTGFILLYVVWIYIINYYTDFWIYPLLGVLNSFQRILFISGLISFISCFYFIGEFLTKQYWGNHILPIQERKKRE